MNKSDFLCGISCWHPRWLQKFATTRSFIVVYGFLGTVQAMAFIYFVITLTTLEKRFKIPSSTTGLILSGNEISQILLSLILSYVGGHRNRPRWIAWGVLCCALSCFILATPHFIYGAGEEALKLTKEYMQSQEESNLILNQNMTSVASSTNRLCTGSESDKECSEVLSILPLVLIFLSQFVLGIGNTLYYSLGQTYLDDNTKKTNTPLMLAYAFSLRTLGPVVGFGFGYLALKIYIDPSKTPIIESTDPRWLGAWWLGWIFLGFVMLIFTVLIGLFPKELPKKKATIRPVSGTPKILLNTTNLEEEETSLNKNNREEHLVELPTLKDFPKALLRLLKNKLLICNISAAIFYILGSSGYITYITKYIEVQFHKNTADATIFTGPLTLFGVVTGMLVSGFVISKKKPSPKKLLMWNVIVGFGYISGQVSNLFLTCPDGKMPLWNGELNLTTSCNSVCACDGIPYSPVCQEETGVTFFSACHAGCDAWDSDNRYYHKCNCYDDQSSPITNPWDITPTISTSTMTATTNLATTFTESTTMDDGVTDSEDSIEWGKMIPGACLKGCAMGFYTFSIVSSVINCFGASGRIGNVLVNYRCVSKQDKSFTQGLMLMLISLFALIPGPILYGRIIDSTCLVWTEECGKRGNCQLYDQKLFRYYFNCTAIGLTSIGVCFDFLVWCYGKDLDLYGEREAQLLEEQARNRNRTLNK